MPFSVVSLAIYFVFAVPCWPPIDASDLSDPNEYLGAAKSLPPNFLLEPIATNVYGYGWEEEYVQNELDKKRHVITTKHREVRKRGPFVTVPQAESAQKESQTAPRDGKIAELISNELWSITRYEFVGRDSLDGRTSIKFSFQVGKDAKSEWLRHNLVKTKGLLWFDEQDKKLVKVEGEHVGDIMIAEAPITSYGIRKGTHWAWQLRKLNNEAWLPAFTERTRRTNCTICRKAYVQNLTNYRNHSKIAGK